MSHWSALQCKTDMTTALNSPNRRAHCRAHKSGQYDRCKTLMSVHKVFTSAFP